MRTTPATKEAPLPECDHRLQVVLLHGLLCEQCVWCGLARPLA